MIRYALRCDRDHAFESWFKDSSAFETLSGLGQITCAVCGSATVVKAPMAPSIVRGRTGPSAPVPPSDDPAHSPAPSPPAVTTDDGHRNLRDLVRDLHRKIAETSDDVGSSFPEEARRMHDGETPARSIHGQATGEEVKAMIDDGIRIMPIPSLPDDQN